MEKIPTLDQNRVHYSDKYSDDKFEYRHVILPKEFAKYIPRTHLLTETEWRNLGIQQSPGWEHYMIHSPEPFVLMFRRAISVQQEESAPQDFEVEAPDVVMDSYNAGSEQESSDEADENYKDEAQVNASEKSKSESSETTDHRGVQFDMALHFRGE